MAKGNCLNKVLGTGLVIAGAAGLYVGVVRPWLLRLGASDDELGKKLPGDDLVSRPRWSFTQAVTIHASPAEIWPWLVQWGFGRGGFYSYDWLDSLISASGVVSAKKILPEYQQLRAGDTVPIAPSGQGFLVKAVEPNRAIVLLNRLDFKTMQSFDLNDPPTQYANVSWVWVLEPQGEERTRLISRARADIAFQGNPLFNIWLGEPLKPGSAFMDWGMLQGIKQRVEAARWGIEDE